MVLVRVCAQSFALVNGGSWLDVKIRRLPNVDMFFIGVGHPEHCIQSRAVRHDLFDK